MKDVEKSRTSFIRVNLRVLREKHLFQCPRMNCDIFYCVANKLYKDVDALLSRVAQMSIRRTNMAIMRFGTQ